MVRPLRLHLKGCYFDAIKAGIKSHEFRLAAKWEKRIINGCYRIGVDEILLLRGYPKSGDEIRMMRRVWNGYRVVTITHTEFGPSPVLVLEIDVTKHPNVKLTDSGPVTPASLETQSRRSCAAPG